MPFCSNCGKENPAGVAYCNNCGSALNVANPESSSQPQYAPPQYQQSQYPPPPQYQQSQYPPPPQYQQSQYPPPTQVVPNMRSYAIAGIISAIISIFFLPPVFGPIAIALGGWILWKGGSKQKQLGWIVVMMGVICMVVGIVLALTVTF